jgi:hypothetical protein
LGAFDGSVLGFLGESLRLLLGLVGEGDAAT